MWISVANENSFFALRKEMEPKNGGNENAQSFPFKLSPIAIVLLFFGQ